MDALFLCSDATCSAQCSQYRRQVFSRKSCDIFMRFPLTYPTSTFHFDHLKFQSEAFFFHFVVALWVELVEKCHFLVGQR